VRHRLRLVVPLAAAAVISVAGCGETKDPPAQTAMWFGLGAVPGATCSSTKVFQIPDGARATTSGASGAGERVEDGGENTVECEVRLASGSTNNYNVDLRLQVGEIGNFVARGALTADVAPEAAGTVDVALITPQFSLAQTKCAIGIEKLIPGAIWLKTLHCDNMRDPSSPGIACDGLGGLIFENCSH
jgi:hypothetical protein